MLSLSEGQPESIVQDIESMVRSYVDKVRIMHISLELTMTLMYFVRRFLKLNDVTLTLWVEVHL